MISRSVTSEIETRHVYSQTATLAGLSFPIMSVLDYIAAGLAIPVALLSIAVLSFRLRNEMRDRRSDDRPIADEKQCK